MKKILVPTDFSENALQALKYAIQIANRFDAKIFVLHAFQVSSTTGSLVNVDNMVQEDREKDMAQLLQNVKPLLSGGATLEGYVRKGGAVELTCEAAEKLAADIIIMGTTGASGMKKMFMGSTASNVIKNTAKPVIAIPIDFKNFQISNITIALDSQAVDEPFVLHPVVELAKKFGCSVNLLQVVLNEGEEAAIDAKVLAHFKQFDLVYTYFKLNAKDVGQGISEFVGRKSSDVLCILHHNRSWFQDLFHSSVATQMAFSSQIPLFVVRG